MPFLTLDLPIPEETPEPGEVCSFCGGPGILLGSLGSREHFRCRNCGTEWSAKKDPDNSYEVSFQV